MMHACIIIIRIAALLIIEPLATTYTSTSYTINIKKKGPKIKKLKFLKSGTQHKQTPLQKMPRLAYYPRSVI